LSNIRVTYSGLISLVVSVLAVLTGTIFVVMVTRKLAPEELGFWTLITTVVGYVLVVEPIVSYWTTRQIARGERVGKTALFTDGLFSIGGVPFYFLIALFVSFSLGVDLFVLLIASSLIPLMFLHGALSAIALGYKPHSEQFAIVGFELSKIPLGVFLIVMLQLGIIGAIMTVIIASVIRIIILLIMLRQQLIDSIKLRIIKFWLRMSWIPMYGIFPGLILTFDVIIFSLITNSLVGLAYWTAGITVAALVAQSGNISRALYPKLLANGKKEYAEENLKRTMYFAIPMLALSIVLAKPLLHIINPIYIDGIYIVYFLAFKSFMAIFLYMAFNIITAYEKVDLDKNASFKQFLKSKLFFIPTLSLIMSGLYIAILIIFLLLIPSTLEEIEAVTIWSFILFTVYIPFTIYALILVKKNHQITLPFVSFLKYSGVTLLASIAVFFISEKVIEYVPSIWDFLPQVIVIAALGGGIYFGLTYVVDSSTRKLFKSIINEIRKQY